MKKKGYYDVNLIIQVKHAIKNCSYTPRCQSNSSELTIYSSFFARFSSYS